MATINIMSLKAARGVAKVSTGNTKMPGTTFAMDAFACNVGSRLAEIKGSTCERCYARKLQAFRSNLMKGWTENQRATIEAIETDEGLEHWAQAVAFQIMVLDDVPEHRWLDSGDSPSVRFLVAVARVAELTPSKRHWLPTREVRQVLDFIRAGHKVPDNMVIRLSAAMVDDGPMSLAQFANIPGILTSTVHKVRQVGGGEHACPAHAQGNACGDCRACWSREVRNVSYPAKPGGAKKPAGLALAA